MPRILIAALAVLFLPALAHAELPESYRQLLAEADRRDTPDERFVEIADMVSVLVPGGRATVHQAILDHFSNRADAVADWPLPDPAPTETPVAEAPQPEHRSIEAPVDLAEAPEGSGSWLAAGQPVRIFLLRECRRYHAGQLARRSPRLARTGLRSGLLCRRLL